MYMQVKLYLTLSFVSIHITTSALLSYAEFTGTWTLSHYVQGEALHKNGLDYWKDIYLILWWALIQY